MSFKIGDEVVLIPSGFHSRVYALARSSIHTVKAIHKGNGNLLLEGSPHQFDPKPSWGRGPGWSSPTIEKLTPELQKERTAAVLMIRKTNRAREIIKKLASMEGLKLVRELEKLGVNLGA